MFVMIRNGENWGGSFKEYAVRCPIRSAFWSILEQTTPSFHIRKSMLLFCSYHILTSSVIYCWTDARQLGIYLLNLSQMYSSTLGWSIPSSYQPHPFGEDLDHLPYLLTSRFEHFLSFLWKCTALPWAWQDHLTKTCWGNQLFEC